MKKIITLAFLLLGYLIPSHAQTVSGPLGERFAVRVVANKLSDPWEITYGPDHELWVTESKGYRVSRINPETGKKTVLLDLNAKREFPRYDLMGKASGGKPTPQGWLMGMALHPKLLQGKPFVYLMYVYKYEGADKPGTGCALNYGGCRFRGRVVRYEYNQSAQSLINPITLSDSIPQSNDHNGGRLTLAPVHGKMYLLWVQVSLAMPDNRTGHSKRILMKARSCASILSRIVTTGNMINGSPTIILLMHDIRMRSGASGTAIRRDWPTGWSMERGTCMKANMAHSLMMRSTSLRKARTLAIR
jgi:hypothetical protein